MSWCHGHEAENAYYEELRRSRPNFQNRDEDVTGEYKFLDKSLKSLIGKYVEISEKDGAKSWGKFTGVVRSWRWHFPENPVDWFYTEGIGTRIDCIIGLRILSPQEFVEAVQQEKVTKRHWWKFW
jgi:hypothetical protein